MCMYVVGVDWNSGPSVVTAWFVIFLLLFSIAEWDAQKASLFILIEAYQS